MIVCRVVGSQATVRHGLEAIVARTGADELMLASQIYDHPARLRSYELGRQELRSLRFTTETRKARKTQHTDIVLAVLRESSVLSMVKPRLGFQPIPAARTERPKHIGRSFGVAY